MAPFSRAASMPISCVSTGKPSKTLLFTRWLIRESSSGVRAEKWVKSKRSRSGSTREPVWWT